MHRSQPSHGSKPSSRPSGSSIASVMIAPNTARSVAVLNHVATEAARLLAGLVDFPVLPDFLEGLLHVRQQPVELGEGRREVQVQGVLHVGEGGDEEERLELELLDDDLLETGDEAAPDREVDRLSEQVERNQRVLAEEVGREHRQDFPRDRVPADLQERELVMLHEDPGDVPVVHRPLCSAGRTGGPCFFQRRAGSRLPSRPAPA